MQKINLKVVFHTRKHLLLTVVVAVIGVGIIVLGIMAQISQISSLFSDYRQEQPKLANVKQKLAELEGVQFTSEFSQIDLVNSALPSRKPLLELLTSINTISSDQQVLIEDLSLSPGEIASQSGGYISNLNLKAGSSKKKTDIDFVVVEMEAVGRPAQVRQFLILLEKVTPFTTITQLLVETKRDQITGDVMTATITTQTYFFTQTLSATVDAPLPQLTDKERDVLNSISDFVENDLPEQRVITGGGLKDLFGIRGYDL